MAGCQWLYGAGGCMRVKWGERLSIEECMVVSSWVMWRNVWM